MALSKGSILKHAGVFEPVSVHVPSLADENGDDVVLLRGMTLREFEINQGRAEDGLATASLMARCIVDASGGRVFDDADVPMLAELPLASVTAISKAIAEASGLGDDDPKQAVASAVADAEKNSPPTTGDGSSSA